MNAPIFSSYARCYELLYRDKDYTAEVHWVDGALRSAGVTPGPLLDIGCGTGTHARMLAALGWHLTGVNRSGEMLALARERAPADGMEFFEGAAADFDLGKKFSAVVSLFHVVSYQAAAGEAARMFANVRRHLAPGGVFIFDFWHGPGVMADPPAVRVQRRSDDTMRLVRIAEPVHRGSEQLVEVNYEVFLDHLRTGEIERIQERHLMRYFFVPELEALLQQAGFVLLSTHAGLVAAPFHLHAWHGAIVARAI